MPGTNPAEAMRVVAGELPDFPHLPRARSMLSSDLDAMEEVLDGFRGPLKIQLCGPWTLAATLELPRTLNVAIADPGAVAELTASLAEGAAAHVAEIAKRVPGAHLVVQFDEPALPAVAGGEVPTASGLSRLRPVEAETLRERLAQVIVGTGKYTVVHSCAPAVPFGIIRAAGAGAVSFDLSQLRRGEGDEVAEAAEAGLGLLIGAVPAVPDPDAGTGVPGIAAPPRGPSGPGDGSVEARQTAERIIRLYHRLGLPLATCPDQVVITPA